MPAPLPASARRMSTTGHGRSQLPLLAQPGRILRGELGNEMPAPVVATPTPRIPLQDKALLVDRVKQLQRSSEATKMMWRRYCNRQGATDYDPNRHDEQFIKTFLDGWDSGKFQPEAGHESLDQGAADMKVVLVQRVKEIQRKSPAQKELWYRFCQSQGTTNYDPLRHDERFLRAFCEKMEGPPPQARPVAASLSSSAAASSQSSSAMHGADAGLGKGCMGMMGNVANTMGMAGNNANANWDDWSAWDAWSAWDDPSAWDGWGADGGWDDQTMSQGAGMTGADGCGKGTMEQMMMMKGKAMGKGPWLMNMMGKGMDPTGKGTDAPGKGMAMMGMQAMSMGMAFAGKGMDAWAGQMPNAAAMAAMRMQMQMQMMQSPMAMGINGRPKSEFGILDAPPQELLNRKRGASSMAAPAAPGGLMTEEQAREFQLSLKRQK